MATQESLDLEKVRTEVFALVETVRTGQCVKQIVNDRGALGDPLTRVLLEFPRTNMHHGQYDLIVCMFDAQKCVIFRYDSHGRGKHFQDRNMSVQVTADNRADCEMFERMLCAVTPQDGDDADTKPQRAIPPE